MTSPDALRANQAAVPGPVPGQTPVPTRETDGRFQRSRRVSDGISGRIASQVVIALQPSAGLIGTQIMGHRLLTSVSFGWQRDRQAVLPFGLPRMAQLNHDKSEPSGNRIKKERLYP